ncbi:MAG: 50S ribosomal protein L1 [Candidatus Bathyarchaeota archaeon]|nr:MAG: 50S ribosomal protein L1 [Candidatus Bathyarchaeota archaeon]
MSLDTKKVLEAVEKVRERTKKKKFNQSVELIINLRDIDMKKPDARIQETVELPHTSSKKPKACIIATGELALKAKKAGADLVIGNSELESLATDKKRQKQIANSYDIFIAEAPLMPLVGRTLGSILGPRGKMPKPVPPTADIKTQITKWSKMVNIRLRSQPVLQCAVGTEDMKNEEVVENVIAVIRRIEGKLKRGLKNVKSIYLKTTMGPPVKIQL